MSQQELDGVGVVPETTPVAGISVTEPDYANDPGTHLCPNCWSRGTIIAFLGFLSARLPQEQPGNAWFTTFGCRDCGAIFFDAPPNRRTPEDINDSTTV